MANDPPTEPCFIISAIRAADAVEPTEADRVWTDLIEPALERANAALNTHLTAHRSDSDPRDGDMWHEILQFILTDRLLFAILDHTRPNVYYEIGIAHSAARPTIILKDKDIYYPFDLNPRRYVEYSLRHLEENGDHIIANLTNSIIATYRHKDEEVAFNDKNLIPLNGARRFPILLEKFKDISFHEWSQVLNKAKIHIDIAGKNLLDFTPVGHGPFELINKDNVIENADLKTLIANRVVCEGVSVTLTIMHPDNPAFEEMITHNRASNREEERRIEAEKLAKALEDWADFVNRINSFKKSDINDDARREYAFSNRIPLPPDKQGNIKLVQLRRGLLKFRVTMTEYEIIATPVLYNVNFSGSCPTIRANETTETYKMLREELQYLKDINTDPSPDDHVPRSRAAE